MKTQEGFSSNENEVVQAQAVVSSNIDELIAEIKASGMNQQLWTDLCLAVAGRSDGNAVEYRNGLISHLNTIGFSFVGLFCHIGKNGAFYRNAWTGKYFYANVVAGEYKCAAFLTY